MTYSIKECLCGYTTDALGIMCDAWQLAAASKPSRLRAVERALHNGLLIQRAVARLNDVERRLLAVAAGHGNPRVSDLLSVPGLYGAADGKILLLKLARAGLLLICPQDHAGAFSFELLTRDYYPETAAPTLMIPPLAAREVCECSPPHYAITSAPEQSPALAAANADRATTDFLETLRIVEMVAPRLTATHTMHRSDTVRALELARDAGLSRESLELSIAIGRQLGCLDARSDRLVTTAEAENWAKRGPSDRTRALVEAYFTCEEMPDLHLFFPQLARTMEDHMPTGSLRRTYHKRLVAHVLAGLERDTWYAIGTLVDTIYRIDANILFLDEHWRAITTNVSHNSTAWRHRAWQTHEARMLAWLVQTLLANMGIIELAEDRSLFRVTPLGRYALGIDTVAPTESTEAQREALVVKPDFEVVVYQDRCPPELRRKLDAFGERANGGGSVVTYRLSQESVYRGVRAGAAVSTFVAMLEAHGLRQLPANVRDQLETWDRKLSALQVRERCRLLECADASEAQRLSQSLHGARRIGERYVLLNGEVPAATTTVHYNGAPGACLVQENGLRLRALWKNAHLFLRRPLAEIGEVRDENGDIVVELDRARIRDGADTEDLVDSLQELTQEPLAPRYRFALQSWKGGGGRAVAATATIVRFDDPEICAGILELPALARHIEGRLGLYALVIKPAQLAKFKKALREQGIRVARADDPISDITPPEVWATEWAQRHAPSPEAETATKRDPSRRRAKTDVCDGQLPSYSQHIMREIVEDAIERRRSLLIEYRSAWSKQPTLRRVNPVSLDANGSGASMNGFCHQIGGARAFKLGQISGIRVLEDEPF